MKTHRNNDGDKGKIKKKITIKMKITIKLKVK